MVVANPANTNCLILSHFTPKIPNKNFTCLTRLDQKRARSLLAIKSQSPILTVKNPIIWGNHSDTQYPDANYATIRGLSAREVIKDDDYLRGEFIKSIRKRGAEIIQARQFSSSLSPAQAISEHLKTWFGGTRKGEDRKSVV